MRFTTGKSTLFWMLVFLSLIKLTFAQTTEGGIVGTVHDEKGADIANAKVTVISGSTGLQRETTTADNGVFRLMGLPTGMEAIRNYEAGLTAETLRRLSQIDGVTVYGIHEERHFQHRVPTICFNLNGLDASVTADRCSAGGIGVRDGNMYSPRLLRRMGIPATSGAVRASLVHYNTVEEIDKFAGVLNHIRRH